MVMKRTRMLRGYGGEMRTHRIAAFRGMETQRKELAHLAW